MGFLNWLFGRKTKPVPTVFKKSPPTSSSPVLANPKPSPKPTPVLKEAKKFPDKPSGVAQSVTNSSDELYLMTIFPEDLTPVYSETEQSKIVEPVSQPVPVAEVSSNYEVVNSPIYESHSHSSSYHDSSSHSSYDSGSSSSYDSGSSSSCDSGSCGGCD